MHASEYQHRSYLEPPKETQSKNAIWFCSDLLPAPRNDIRGKKDHKKIYDACIDK